MCLKRPANARVSQLCCDVHYGLNLHSGGQLRRILNRTTQTAAEVTVADMQLPNQLNKRSCKRSLQFRFLAQAVQYGLEFGDFNADLP